MKIDMGNGYAINISTKNNKMGKVYSFSLLPIVTCAMGIPCYRNCYAVKLSRLRTTVRNSWKENTEAIRNLPPKEVIDTLVGYISWTRCRYFRWNVSGDFNIRNYWDITAAVAEQCPETKFLAFTKCYWTAEKPRPENYNLVLSVWKEYKPRKITTGLAYYNDGTYPIPSNAKECLGNCEKCGKCFNLKAGEAVYFNKH
jgi:hypothetical protein